MITRFTCGLRIRATSQQLPVTSNATRSVRLQAVRQHRAGPRVLTAPARRRGPYRPHRSRPHRSRGAHPDRSPDRPISPTARLTSRQLVDSAVGEPAGQRHRPIRARSSIQANRRGGRTKTTGSKPIDQNGLPDHVLPNKAPVLDAPELRTGPGHSLRKAVSCFEARKCRFRGSSSRPIGAEPRIDCAHEQGEVGFAEPVGARRVAGADGLRGVSRRPKARAA